MKAAAITGRLNELINCVSNRHVVLISSENNSALFRSINIKKFTHISIDHHRARHSRFDILQNIAEVLSNKNSSVKDVVIFVSSGGALATWLSLEIFNKFPQIKLIDIGGMPSAFWEPTGPRTNWTRVYNEQINASLKFLRLDKPNCVKRTRSPYGIRSEKLVNIAKLHGVTAPEYLHELPLKFFSNESGFYREQSLRFSAYI